MLTWRHDLSPRSTCFCCRRVEPIQGNPPFVPQAGRLSLTQRTNRFFKFGAANPRPSMRDLATVYWTGEPHADSPSRSRCRSSRYERCCLRGCG